MAGLRSLERQRDDFRRPEVFDDEHVRILAQRRARHHQQLVAIAAHFALADERAAVLVHELDLVLDRDDVIAARAVDQIDERRDERRLAARAAAATSTRPSASAHSPWISRDSPSCSAEIARRRNHAEDAAGAAMIAERDAADAARRRARRKSTRCPPGCAALRGCARG